MSKVATPRDETYVPQLLKTLDDRLTRLERLHTTGGSAGGALHVGDSVTGDVQGSLLGPITINPASTPQMAKVGLGVAAGASRLTFATDSTATGGITFGTANSVSLYQGPAAGDVFLTGSGSSTRTQFRVNSPGTTQSAVLSLDEAGTEKWRLWKSTGNNLLVYNAEATAQGGPHTHVTFFTTGTSFGLIRLLDQQVNGLTALTPAANSNATLTAGGPIDSRYPNFLNSTGAARWEMNCQAINGNGGVRNQGAGTVTTVTTGGVTTVTCSTSGFPTTGSANGKVFRAVTTAGGLVTYHEGIVANYNAGAGDSATQLRLTGAISNGDIVSGDTPKLWAINPEDISINANVSGYGAAGGYASFPSAMEGSHRQWSWGSYNILNFSGSIDDAADGGVDGYGEFSTFSTHQTANRLGALSVCGEWQIIVNAGKQGRIASFFGITTEANTYASYTASNVGSAFKDAGSTTIWAQASGAGEAGTGIYILDANQSSFGYRRAITYNSGGLDLFSVDGHTGWVGIGGIGSTGVMPYTNQSGTISNPLTISLAAGSVPTVMLNNTSASQPTTLTLKNSGTGLTGTASSVLMFANSNGGITTNTWSLKTGAAVEGPFLQIHHETTGNNPIRVLSNDTVNMTTAAANPALNTTASGTWDAGGVGGNLIRHQVLSVSTTLTGGTNSGRTAGNRTNDDGANSAGASFFLPSAVEVTVSTLGSFNGYNTNLTNAYVTAAFTITAVSQAAGTVTVTATNTLAANDSVKITGTGTSLDGHYWTVASATGSSFTITTTYTGSVSLSSALAQKLDYHEATGFDSLIYHDSAGALSVCYEAALKPSAPGRVQGFAGVITPQAGGDYASYTGTDGTNAHGTSSWNQTGPRLFWARNNSATLNAGSAFVADDAGGGWQFTFLYNQGAAPNTLGTQQFAVSGLAASPGYVALGNTSASFPARLTFVTDTTAAGGIQFGTTGTNPQLYRSASGVMRLDNGNLGISAGAALASTAISGTMLFFSRTGSLDIGRTSGSIIRSFNQATGSANPSFTMSHAGVLAWGDGANATDVSIGRGTGALGGTFLSLITGVGIVAPAMRAGGIGGAGFYEILTQSANPSQPNSTDARVYIKNGNMVFQYNDGGTTRYTYTPLNGTVSPAVWTHDTTGP